EQVMKYGRQYRDGKITWQQFREKARLDLLDGKNGPITRAIKEAIDAGDLQAAAHRAADFTRKLALFTYNRGTTPRALDGAMGRLLGQYGTYPLGFLNFLHHIATVGDEGLTKNKIKAMGAMIEGRAAMREAMEPTFGGGAAKG